MTGGGIVGQTHFRPLSRSWLSSLHWLVTQRSFFESHSTTRSGSFLLGSDEILCEPPSMRTVAVLGRSSSSSGSCSMVSLKEGEAPVNVERGSVSNERDAPEPLVDVVL